MARGRPPRPSGTPGRGARTTTGAEGARSTKAALPSYEAPAAPLNANGKMALRSLISHNEQSGQLLQQLAATQALVAEAAADVAEMTQGRGAKMARQRERLREAEARLGTGDVKDDDAVRDLRARLAELEEDARDKDSRARAAVDALEGGARGLVDTQARLEDRQAALADAVDAAEAAASRGRAAGLTQGSAPRDDADGQQAESAALSVLRALQEKVAEKSEAWQGLSMHQRYGANNEYVHFRRALHDVQNPSEAAPPVPRATAWFDEAAKEPRLLHSDGADAAADAAAASQPQPPGTQGSSYGDSHPNGETAAGPTTTAAAAAGDEDDDDDDDDDVQAVTERISIQCPLTLQPMREPVTSTRCPHSFERAAIEEMIEASGVAQRRAGRGGRGAPLGPKAMRCPVCSQMLTKDDLRPDLVLARRIARILEARRRAEAGDEDDDDDDGDRRRPRRSVMPITSSSPAPSSVRRRTVKPEPRASMAPAVSLGDVDMRDDDDDDDDDDEEEDSEMED